MGTFDNVFNMVPLTVVKLRSNQSLGDDRRKSRFYINVTTGRSDISFVLSIQPSHIYNINENSTEILKSRGKLDR